MRQPLYLFLLLLLIGACESTPSENELPFTTIKGKITHPLLLDHVKKLVDAEELEKDRKKVALFSNAIRAGLEQPNHTTLADEAGNYQFVIRIKEPTEVRLQYGSRDNIPLLVAPGEEIIVDIDKGLQTGTTNFGGYRIAGDNAATNLIAAKYDQLFYDSFQVELRATLPYVIPREFKTQREKVTQRVQKFTNDFIQEYATGDPFLADWISHHAGYRLAMDYMRYAFKTSRRIGLSPALKDGFPIHYFDFWEEFPIDNPKAIPSLNYQNYLQLYRKYLMAILAQTESYQDCKDNSDCNHYELELQELITNLTGRIKDLSIAQQTDQYLVRNDLLFLEKGYPNYLAAISDSLIVQDLQWRKKELYGERAFDYPKNATLFQTDASGEQLLKDIKQRHSGRATLLYFWNTETTIMYDNVPSEMGGYAWKALDTLGFDLVLLAHHSTPNAWKDEIIELGLIEDQWHLTDEQFAYFNHFFDQHRKKHQFYDKIRYYENFILAIDEEGELAIPNLSFYPLSFVVSNIKWQIKKGKNINYIQL